MSNSPHVVGHPLPQGCPCCQGRQVGGGYRGRQQVHHQTSDQAGSAQLWSHAAQATSIHIDGSADGRAALTGCRFACHHKALCMVHPHQQGEGLLTTPVAQLLPHSGPQVQGTLPCPTRQLHIHVRERTLSNSLRLPGQGFCDSSLIASLAVLSVAFCAAMWSPHASWRSAATSPAQHSRVACACSVGYTNSCPVCRHGPVRAQYDTKHKCQVPAHKRPPQRGRQAIWVCLATHAAG